MQRWALGQKGEELLQGVFTQIREDLLQLVDLKILDF